MTQPISIGSDNIVSIANLKDTSTDAYINDATVSFTLYTSAGVAVTGATSVSMPYVATSNGKYEGNLQDTVTLAEGNYYLLITASKTGLVRLWRVPCQAKYTITD